MAKDTSQKWVGRNRAPRVQITYEVETGNSIEKKELAFVVGVMSNLAGKQAKPLPKLKDRKFVEIDRDNFDDVMKGMGPRLAFQVDEKITNDPDKQLNVELTFETMEDFEPARVVERVAPLAELYDARKRLTDLLATLDGNDALEDILNSMMKDQDKLQQLMNEARGGDNGTN